MLTGEFGQVLFSLAPTGYSLSKVDLLLLLTASVLTVPLLYHKCLRFARHFSIEWVPLVDTHCIGQFGGDEGDRTPDLDSAIVALSQLSYVPELGRSYHIGTRL